MVPTLGRLNYIAGNRCTRAPHVLREKTCAAGAHAKLARPEGVCMLPSQRALFDMPRDVCFLNAAAWSPLPLASQEAGRAAMARKGQPWKLPDGFQRDQYERTRKAAAALIGAEPDDVALISSVGYGVST